MILPPAQLAALAASRPAPPAGQAGGPAQAPAGGHLRVLPGQRLQVSAPVSAPACPALPCRCSAELLYCGEGYMPAEGRSWAVSAGGAPPAPGLQCRGRAGPGRCSLLAAFLICCPRSRSAAGMCLTTAAGLSPCCTKGCAAPPVAAIWRGEVLAVRVVAHIEWASEGRSERGERTTPAGRAVDPRSPIS